MGEVLRTSPISQHHHKNYFGILRISPISLPDHSNPISGAAHFTHLSTTPLQPY
jgi:hypothetical protein